MLTFRKYDHGSVVAFAELLHQPGVASRVFRDRTITEKPNVDCSHSIEVGEPGTVLNTSSRVTSPHANTLLARPFVFQFLRWST